MPLYELFCLARPSLNEVVLKNVIKKAALQVLDKKGVLLEVISYGDAELAYPIRIPNDQVYQQVS